MTDPTTFTGVSRRRLLETAGAALAAAAAGAIAEPAEAAAPQVMPFKATFTASFQSLMIPLDLPVVHQLVTGSGQSDQLGPFTVAAHRVVQLGLNGEQLGSGANPGVFTADNGDALYWITDQAPGGFVITGGRGRFCGAAGSGTVTGTPNPATGAITFAWEGMIQVPRM